MVTIQINMFYFIGIAFVSYYRGHDPGSFSYSRSEQGSRLTFRMEFKCYSYFCLHSISPKFLIIENIKDLKKIQVCLLRYTFSWSFPSSPFFLPLSAFLSYFFLFLFQLLRAFGQFVLAILTLLTEKKLLQG